MTDIDEDKGRNSKYVLKDYEKVSKGKKQKFQKKCCISWKNNSLCTLKIIKQQ